MERAGRRFERQVNEALQHNPEVEQYVLSLRSREDEPTRRRIGLRRPLRSSFLAAKM